MRAYSKPGFQMLCVHQDSHKVITVGFQSKKHSAANIVYSGFHSPVHGLCVICIITFRSCGVKSLIAFFIISFLEKNIGSDSRFFQLPVIFYCRCCNVYIHTADGSVFVFDAVNGFDTFQNVFNGIVFGILSCLQSKTLMSHVLKGDYLLADLLLSQFFTADVFVLCMIRTVNTAVDTIIRKVKRRKHNNSVSIKFLFDLFCHMKHFIHQHRIITFQKKRCFSVT